jgi:hypothetical protein
MKNHPPAGLAKASASWRDSAGGMADDGGVIPRDEGLVAPRSRAPRQQAVRKSL